jgi:uncharacterized protein YjbJ (UPF0337 family)
VLVDKDRIEGDIKEKAGKLTGDKELEGDGKSQESWGKSKDKARDAWDDTKDAVDDAKDSLDRRT